MQITCLVENTSCRPECEPAHGLRLWIKTGNQHVLMDAGPSDLLCRNAQVLGIDFAQASMLVLSHGHYDHADGIPAFASVNPSAPVYLRRTAVRPYHSSVQEDGTRRYIGMDPAVSALPQLKLTDGETEIGEGLRLFGDITGRRMWPESNLRLFAEKDGSFVQDSFDHEQCLTITENGRTVLFSGCAHNGILNILDRYRELYGGAPYAVVSGFHMKKSGGYTAGEEETIRATARELHKQPTLFYTCHCTGLPAFDMMKEIMGNQLHYLACGQTIHLLQD